MRPAFEDKVIATVKVTKAGKTLAIGEVTVTVDENIILAKIILPCMQMVKKYRSAQLQCLTKK